MMDLKWAAALVLALSIASGLVWYQQSAFENKRYVFINETNDHRHDESIRVSIIAAEQRSGVQNAVVISELAASPSVLFKQLGLGRATNGKAILYVYRPERHQLDIEVGYALEALLPDSTIKAFETAAKTFTYTQRMQDFWAELMITLNMQIVYQRDHSKDDSQNYDFSKFRYLSGGAGVSAQDYDPSWEQFLSESKIGVRTYRSGDSVQSVVDQYILSMAEGDVSSDIELLAPESKFFRTKNRFSSFYYYRNARMYQKTHVQKTYSTEQLAVVFFSEEYAVLPIVLRRIRERWYISEPLSWSLFQRFEDSNRVFLKFPIQWNDDSLNAHVSKRLGPPLYPLKNAMNVSNILTQFEQSEPSIEFVHLVLYDLYAAKNLLERQKLTSLTSDQLGFLSDIYNNLGEFSNFLRVYEAFAYRWPKEKRLATNLNFYRDIYTFSDRDWQLK